MDSIITILLVVAVVLFGALNLAVIISGTATLINYVAFVSLVVSFFFLIFKA